MAFRIDDPPVTFSPVNGLMAPTRQDTLDLIARSEMVRRAMEEARNERGKRMYEEDESISRRKSMPKQQALAKLENARRAMEEREAMKSPTIVELGEKARERRVIPAQEYARQVGPSQFEQKEIENRIINPDIPMSLYDTRVQPDTVYFYTQRKAGRAPDLVSIPGYSTRMMPRGQQPQAEVVPDIIAEETPAIKLVQPVKRPMQRIPAQQDVERVSFGTRGNRPLYSPGMSGRRAATNRMAGRGAYMSPWERLRDLFD